MTTPTSRRRGATLEAAILAAGWALLTDVGAQGFTFEAVAERARTGKPVLYRRWPTRLDLLVAVLQQRIRDTDPPLPDNGRLRDDVLAALRSMNGRWGADFPALISGVFSAYFDETGAPPAQLRALILGGRGNLMSTIIDRAVSRGELAHGDLPDRVLRLPADLLRNELMMALRPVPDETIVEIVDTVFLPLVRAVTRTPMPAS